MLRTSFNEGWTVEEARLMEMAPGADQKKVTLPHDITIEQRRKECPSDASAEETKQQALAGGWPSGFYKYRKEFSVPEGWKNRSVYLEFEGAYRDATVLVDDDFVTHHANGYTSFLIDLKPWLRFGGVNSVSVTVKNSADARWYAGAGLYRPVHLMVGNLVHIAPEGLMVHTERIDKGLAVIGVSFTVKNQDVSRTACSVLTTILDREGREAASDRSRVTVFPGEEVSVRRTLYVENPSLWDEKDPALYTVRVTLLSGEEELDICTDTFGIRTLSADPKNGLLVNGKTVLLRGGCIHEDKGALGLATFDVSEERRVKKLKEAGFNAIRMAHHPASRSLMRACDRYGMYLMDEFSDVWGRGKTRDDYADRFAYSWEEDITSMVRDAYNHPSVILYSIGNEIADIDYGFGGRMSRKLADKVKGLDPYRLTTNCINGLVGLSAMGEQARPEQPPQTENAQGQEGDINVAMTDLVMMMEQLMQSPAVGDAIEESCEAVDISGYNYMTARYELDGQLYPNRVIVGSETYPPEIAANWAKVRRLPYLIGDFTWTAWDYLGEAGIAHTTYGDLPVYKNYPYRSSYDVDLDLTGHRRPLSFYREVVFGQSRGPYLFAQNPEVHGLTPNATPWCWHDVEALWTYEGCEGKETRVEVYADAPLVTLTLNGKEVGRGECTEENEYLMSAESPYESGELEAAAYDETGCEIGRCVLRTAQGESHLVIRTETEKVASGYDNLIYFEVAREDAAGAFDGKECRVQAEVEGSGRLAGLQSGSPVTKDEFFETECDTWQGHLTAIVRPEGEGKLKLKLHCDGNVYESAVVTVTG